MRSRCDARWAPRVGASFASCSRKVCCLAFLGAATGAGLALLLSRTLLNFRATSRESFELQLTLDWRVLAFTAIVATATCVLFGLLPAIRASAGRSAGIMKSASRTMTAGRDRFSLQRALVVAQVGLSLVLLLGALLFVQSFRNLNRQDTGLTIDGLIFAGIRLDAMRPDRERVRPLQQEVLDRLRALPGITSVATSSHIPLDGMSWTLRTTIPGHESAGSGIAAVHVGEPGLLPHRAGRPARRT